MVKRFISTLVLVVALVGSVSAQNLDDISKKVFDLSIEAINKGMNRMSAYEEYLEKQELEAAKKAEEERKAEEEAKKAEEDKFKENCNILADVAILYPSERKVWMKCYCYPVGDYVWYTIYYGDDNNWWLKLAYDNNGEVGVVFYATIFRDLDYIKVKDDISGKETAAIKLINTVGYIVVIQDAYNPETFTINW